MLRAVRCRQPASTRDRSLSRKPKLQSRVAFCRFWSNCRMWTVPVQPMSWLMIVHKTFCMGSISIP